MSRQCPRHLDWSARKQHHLRPSVKYGFWRRVALQTLVGHRYDLRLPQTKGTLHMVLKHRDGVRVDLLILQPNVQKVNAVRARSCIRG